MALVTSVNVGMGLDWLAFFASSNSTTPEYDSLHKTKHWQDIAQYVAIAGYFFNILVLIVVTSFVTAAPKSKTSSVVSLLVLVRTSLYQ